MADKSSLDALRAEVAAFHAELSDFELRWRDKQEFLASKGYMPTSRLVYVMRVKDGDPESTIARMFSSHESVSINFYGDTDVVHSTTKPFSRVGVGVCEYWLHLKSRQHSRTLTSFHIPISSDDLGLPYLTIGYIRFEDS